MRAGLPLVMRAHRKALRLTQQQAAEFAGWKHKTSWLKLEQGKADPRLCTFEKIAAALKLSPVELARLCVEASQVMDAGGWGVPLGEWESGDA